MRVHWAEEGPPSNAPNEPVSDDPTEVTCGDCLRILTMLMEIEEHMAATAGPCPECGEKYPRYYSPKGSVYVFCDTCGYTSDPERM